MDLYAEVTPIERQHPIFRMLMAPENAPERRVLLDWAAGFHDRDGKFVQEFQTTYESSHWELYLHAVLKELGASIDYSVHAPDFVVECGGSSFTIEATISGPAAGGLPAYGRGAFSLPDDFNEFNREATLRLCNSFISKVRKYRDGYSGFRHVQDKPFVLALASFDRPHAQLSANRPIFLTLYGEYFDEEATISSGAESIVNYTVGEVEKRRGTNVPVGLFRTEEFSDVSAVIYSSVATWGKVRALADKPDGKMVFFTFHPQEGTLEPQVKKTAKREYREHLLDGLYVFHNPYAAKPLDASVFSHDRVAQYLPSLDGGLTEICADDFLLLRHIISANEGVNDLLEAFDSE